MRGGGRGAVDDNVAAVDVDRLDIDARSRDEDALALVAEVSLRVVLICSSHTHDSAVTRGKCRCVEGVVPDSRDDDDAP